LPAVLGTIILGLLALTSTQVFMPTTSVQVVPVVVKSVEGRAGTVSVQAPGWLEPDPYPVFVAALVSGVVEDVLVLEGERVEKGAIVARLVNDDQRLRIRRADAMLQQRRAEHAATLAEFTAAAKTRETLIERTRLVATTAAMRAQRHADLQRIDADIAVEEATLHEIQDEYNRKEQLVETHAVAEAVVERLRLRIEAQTATVAATRAQRSVIEAQLRDAEAQHDAALERQTLLIDEDRAVALAQAAVDNANAAIALAEVERDDAALQFARTEVRAPVAGVVMRRLVAPGSPVMMEGSDHAPHIVHLYDPEHLQVRVDVPLADAGRIAIGQVAEISVEVLADRTFTGRVTRTVHQADIAKNTVEVKVAIDAPSVELKPDMLARVRFLAEVQAGESSQRDRVFAPRGLIRRADDGSSSVRVITDNTGENARIAVRAVVTGAQQMDDWIEITSGLQPGDLLVADPNTTLTDGARVRIIGQASTGSGA
jgi:RND family efflux transporter MFP subunit